jgi:hypothetical protein
MAGLSLGYLGVAPKSWNKKAKGFFEGTPEQHENVSTLRPEQEPLYEQAVNAGLNPGAGGAFGDAADYYRDLLSNDSQTAQMLEAPELRRFNEQIIPDIGEQFAGMGAGGLSSSGFRNSAINAGTDLSERLGAIRANLRNQGAQGLQNIGQTGLNNYSKDVVTQPGTEGLLSQAAPLIGTAIGSFAGPFGSAAGAAAGNWLKNSWGGGNVGQNSSPYGGNNPSSGGSKLPNFMGR